LAGRGPQPDGGNRRTTLSSWPGAIEEIAAAQGLLIAAGVDTRVETPGTGLDLPGNAQRVLAWAVREGTTNLLRHSNATICTIILTRSNGITSLDISRTVRPPPAGGPSVSCPVTAASTSASNCPSRAPAHNPQNFFRPPRRDLRVRSDLAMTTKKESVMSKIIYWVHTSVDGFIDGRAHEIAR
jgi:hypothetical protein